MNMVTSRWTKNGKTGGVHKNNPSFQIQTTDVSIAQAIINPRIVQRGTMEVVSRGVLKAPSLLTLSILSSFSLLTTSQVLNFGVEVC